MQFVEIVKAAKGGERPRSPSAHWDAEEITVKYRRELLPSMKLLGKCHNKWSALTTLTLASSSGHNSQKITNKSNFQLLYFHLLNEATPYYQGTTLSLIWDDLPQQSDNNQLTTPAQSWRSRMMNGRSRPRGGDGGLGDTRGTPRFPYDTGRASHLHPIAWATLARKCFGVYRHCSVT